MTVPIKQDILPRNKRPGHSMKPQYYITIHDTENSNRGANAEMHNKWLHSTAAPNPSWHFTVDDKVIYQHLPLNENGWHAGDGVNGTGNRQSIGVEICMNRDGNRAAAEANAAWLTAKLLRDFSLGLDRVKQHYDWSGKNCPRVLRTGDGWDNFLNQVRGFLDASSSSGSVPRVTRTVDVYVNGKKTAAVGYLIKNTTYVPVAFVVGLVGGNVTGHGDHVRISLPRVVERLEAEVAALKTRIENARKALS